MHLTRLTLAATLLLGASLAHAQTQGGAQLKVGLMLPAAGAFAALGTAIENGFRRYVTEQCSKLSGRAIEFVKVDDESDPAKATDNVNQLTKRDNVDVHGIDLQIGRGEPVQPGQPALRRRAADAVHRPRADDAARPDHPRRSH